MSKDETQPVFSWDSSSRSQKRFSIHNNEPRIVQVRQHPTILTEEMRSDLHHESLKSRRKRENTQISHKKIDLQTFTAYVQELKKSDGNPSQDLLRTLKHLFDSSLFSGIPHSSSFLVSEDRNVYILINNSVYFELIDPLVKILKTNKDIPTLEKALSILINMGILVSFFVFFNILLVSILTSN